MAHIADHSPVFTVKNNSTAPKKVDRLTIQPGEEIDLCGTISEYELLKSLTSGGPLLNLIRSGDISVVRSTVMHQFAGAAADLQVQAPLRYVGGLLTVDFASRKNPGVLSSQDFSAMSATSDAAKVWLAFPLTKGDGPEIAVDLSDQRILAVHTDTAIVRSKASPTRAPGVGVLRLGKPTGVIYLTPTRLVLNSQLTEDAVLWVAASVAPKEAPSMASDPPPNIFMPGGAHQRQVTAESAKIGTIEAESAKFASVQFQEMTTPLRVPPGHGITVDGGGKFTHSPFPYVGHSPPNEAYDGMLWHRLPEYRTAFWCDQDTAWYWCDRKVMVFDGAQGAVQSAGMGYRTAGCEGKIDRIVIESQGKTTIALAIDGKTVQTLDAAPVCDQYLNISVAPATRIKLFQEGSQAPMFIATIYIRARAA